MSGHSSVLTWHYSSMQIFVLSQLLVNIPFVFPLAVKIPLFFRLAFQIIKFPIVQNLSRCHEAIPISSRRNTFFMSSLIFHCLLKWFLPFFYVNVLCFSQTLCGFLYYCELESMFMTYLKWHESIQNWYCLIDGKNSFTDYYYIIKMISPIKWALQKRTGRVYTTNDLTNWINEDDQDILNAVGMKPCLLEWISL